MIDLVLVNPVLKAAETVGKKLEDTASKVAPLGLCDLAAVLKRAGYSVSILDIPALEYLEDEALEVLLEQRPRIVGLTAVTVSVYNAARFAELVKQADPTIITVLGGPHITSVREETMRRFLMFDIGAVKEAETTVVELVEAVRNNGDLRNVKGLLLREGDRIVFTGEREILLDLDSLPFPAWDLLPRLDKFYRPSPFSYKRLPSSSLISSRGCPGKCVFCDTSVFGGRWRGYSAQRVIAMIKFLVSEYGIRDVQFLDDLFVVNRGRLREFCRTMMDEKFDVSWSCLSRVDGVKPDILKMMADAGCWQMAYGMESANQEILDVLDKRIKVEQIANAIKWTREAGMRVKGLFMAGNPLETRETLAKTERFIEEMGIDDVSWAAFTPLPGTAIYATARQYGEFEDDWGRMNLWTPLFVPWGLTREDIEAHLARVAKKPFDINEMSAVS